MSDLASEREESALYPTAMNCYSPKLLLSLCFSGAFFMGSLQAQSPSYQEYFKAGMEALLRKDISSGANTLTKALKINPNGIEARFQRSRAYLSMRKPDLALADANELIRQQPRHAGGYYCRAEALCRLGNYGKAFLDINQSLKLDPVYGPSYTSRGKLNHVLGRTEDALLDYALAIEVDPGDQSAYYNRALLNAGLNRSTQAISDLVKVLQIDSSDVQARLELAKLYYIVYNNEKAIFECNVVLKNFPEDSHSCAYAFALRGDAHNALGEAEKAVADITQSIALRPGDPLVMCSRAAAYFRLEKYKEAIADADQGLQLKPFEPGLLVVKAHSYVALGAGESALTAAEELVKRAPGEANSYACRSAVFRTLKKLSEARMDANKAVELAPHDVDGWCNRGLILSEMRIYDQAIADFTHVLKLDPNHFHADYNLAVVYLYQQENQLAMRHATRGCELANWKGGSSLDVMARVCVANSQFEEALKWQRKALACPDVPSHFLVDAKSRLEMLERKLAEKSASPKD